MRERAHSYRLGSWDTNDTDHVILVWNRLIKAGDWTEVDRYRSQALGAFITTASQDRVHLDPTSLERRHRPVSGPETWHAGETPQWSPCPEAEATHWDVTWRIRVLPDDSPAYAVAREKMKAASQATVGGGQDA